MAMMPWGFPNELGTGEDTHGKAGDVSRGGRVGLFALTSAPGDRARGTLHRLCDSLGKLTDL